jgi:hypothetical protein
MNGLPVSDFKVSAYLDDILGNRVKMRLKRHGNVRVVYICGKFEEAV